MANIVETMTQAYDDNKKRADKVLKDVGVLLKDKGDDYGPTGEILDIIGELTGYTTANISLQEKLATTRVITKVIRLMNIRSKKNHKFENAVSECQDIVGEAARLYSAVLDQEGEG